MAATTQDPAIGARTAAYMFAAFLLMATAGPLLATCVRYRRWPLQRERIGVVVAVLIGIGLSYFADMWASAYIEQAMRATPSAPLAKPRSLRQRSLLLGQSAGVAAS